MRRLDRKIALVTGGVGGIGRAIAQRLTTDGATVVITDVQGDQGLALAEEYGFVFLEQDVCDEARWGEVIGKVEERFGRLNVLVNNAGSLGPADSVNPENTTLVSWRRVFSVNVESVFPDCRAAIAALRRTGEGSLVNVCSIAALAASPNSTAYGSSKAAVRQLTKSVAQYCAQQKLSIRCNSVHPGPVLTPLWIKQAQENANLRRVSVESIIEQARQSIPVGEFINSEDIAAAVSFLISGEARDITGTEMIVDSGLMHCGSY
jgi:NAD(P)-dependent dehydrogenase (short-subunit alcohol dehydrogenase family)